MCMFVHYLSIYIYKNIWSIGYAVVIIKPLEVTHSPRHCIVEATYVLAIAVITAFLAGFCETEHTGGECMAV